RAGVLFLLARHRPRLACGGSAGVRHGRHQRGHHLDRSRTFRRRQGIRYRPRRVEIRNRGLSRDQVSLYGGPRRLSIRVATDGAACAPNVAGAIHASAIAQPRAGQFFGGTFSRPSAPRAEEIRMLRKSLKIIGALLALLLVAAAVYVWRSFPRLDGEMRAAGLTAPVLVRRDPSDVTHIQAQSIADAAFALGWVHAQERGWQLEFNRRVMHGELSEVLGSATLETDKLLRTLGIMQSAQAQWQRLPDDAKAAVQAYANGINSFHSDGGQALPPEFHIIGTQPGTWTPQDTMGWALMMALDLGGNWGNEFARLSALQRIDTQALWQLMPPYSGEPPATAVDLAALYRGLGVYRNADGAVRTSASPNKAPGSGVLALVDAAQINDWASGLGDAGGKGSNNWVVAGSHTPSGKPLLANDPHLGLAAPAIWYFARLQAPAPAGGKPLDVIGATLPGAPGVVLGRTAGVAWG